MASLGIVFSRLLFALNPSHGEGLVDRFKTPLLVFAAVLLGCATGFGWFPVDPTMLSMTIAAALGSLGLDVGFHQGAYEEPRYGPPVEETNPPASP
jgi:hypothetical protein